VGFGSKERPKNGIFGVFPARKMGRQPKPKEGGGGGKGRFSKSRGLSASVSFLPSPPLPLIPWPSRISGKLLKKVCSIITN